MNPAAALAIKKIPLRELIRRALAPERRSGPPILLPFPEGTTVHEGPFYSNRAMRRANGERQYLHGYGRMDVPRARVGA